MARRGLKLCCGVMAIFVVVLVIVITTLSLTVFKLKQPQVTAHAVGLDHASFTSFPNVTLSMIVTIDNKNHGSFNYHNTTAYVNYRGDIVAEVPIQGELVPARGKLNITTHADLMADKLIWNPYFSVDVGAGSLNLTSTANLFGEVTVLKVFNLHARAFSTCDISIWLNTQKVASRCKSKIKL